MIDIQSPVPLTEGETIAWGLTTKHALHFVIGIGVSSPIAGLIALLSSFVGVSPWAGLLCSVMLGLAFAVVPWKGRTLSDICWLSVRYAMRPKTLLYDRQYRVRAHRAREAAT